MIIRDKFHVIGSSSGHKIITIRSDYIDECMKYYNQHKDIDGVYICRGLGYELPNIAFLDKHRYIKGISISDGNKIDLSGIENLKELEYISISDNTQPIDYSVFPKLEQIRSIWHPKVILPEGSKLKHLCLWHYKPESKSLIELSDLPNLEFMGMIQSSIKSTEGIGRFKRLKKIELAYLPNLETLCDMKNLDIEIADIHNCKKIQNLDYIGTVKSLKRLICDKCGSFTSIKLVGKLKSLEHFSFLDIDVLDGDMTPCLSIPCTAFTNKKYFTHTMEQINKLKGAPVQKRLKPKKIEINGESVRLTF